MKRNLQLSLVLLLLLAAAVSAPLAARPQQQPGAATVDNEGFIRTWLVLAPISSESEDYGAGEVDKEQIKGEAALKPKEGDKVTVGGKELTWKKVTAPDYFVDFRNLVGQGTDNVVAYAVAYIVADEEMKDLKLKMGSNDQAKLYLNGKPVMKFEETRTLEKDQNMSEAVTLNKGLNVLVFKVINEQNNWQGAVRFTDKSDAPVKGLKVASAPQ